MSFLYTACAVPQATSPSGSDPGAGPGTTQGTDDPNALGQVALDLTSAPSGVQCLYLAAVPANGMTVTKTFALSTGTSTSSLSFGTLPTGPASFSGYAYNVACASIGSVSPTWSADPALVTVMPGALVTASLTFRPINSVNTSINFVPNLAGTATGMMSSFAVTDGAPLQWGWINGSLVPQRVPGLADATAVVGGYYHACALRSDGSVWCWGSNTNGQVGTGVGVNGFASAPVQVPLPYPMTLIAAGAFHTCAYSQSAVAMYCWGSSSNGQLGNGTNTSSATPVRVNVGFYPVHSLAGGYYYTLAATSDGHYLAWGANAFGQLGDGTTTDRWTPVYVAADSTIQNIAAGYDHSCAVHADGSASCWGYNNYGQIGDATTTQRLTPTRVAAVIPGPLKQVVAGMSHSCARTTDGRVYCWGYNADGELGDLSGLNKSSPVQVSFGGDTALTLSSGYQHSCALMTSLNVLCWGVNGNGQIGDGTYNYAFGPTKVMLQ